MEKPEVGVGLLFRSIFLYVSFSWSGDDLLITIIFVFREIARKTKKRANNIGKSAGATAGELGAKVN